ncbi:MAG: UvrD-helicase domain-containing protein [Bacteroidaceae bacterium]|nr:UvrD-helicase domain-containing protein [Bacteroidaceae bacterium]
MKSLKPIKIYKASAGSGKTFTLAVEYITLLAVNPMAYQNILAVTFTNKATAEMKQRILSTLYGISHGLQGAKDYVENIMENIEAMKALPQWQEKEYRKALEGFNLEILRERAQEALENIIHDYSRFHIETIDSFFQGIVRDLANELELSTNLKVELDETEVLSDAIDQIIENLKEGSSEFRTIIEFIEEKIRENRSWQVEETVKEFGMNIFKEKYLIYGEDIRKKITDYGTIYNYRDTINTYLAEKKRAVTSLGEKMLEAYEDIGITEKDGSQTIVSFMEKVRYYKITEPTNTSRGTFSDAIEEYTTNVDKWFKKNSKSRDILQIKVKEILQPMLQEAYKKHQEYVSHLHTVNAIGQHLYSLMLLNEMSRMVKSLNEENNRFLLSETANFLRNVINNQDIPFIYEKTGTVIKHIMIDEFQDTSTLQWGNFKPLIMNSLAMDGECLIVGDVKQSIYRFRNSDWQILNGIEEDEELKDYIGRIPASYNYRSSHRVVDFNNELFKNAIEILKEKCPALSLAYSDLEQKAKREPKDGFVRVENIDYHGVDPDSQLSTINEELEEATLQRIQLSVKELIDNGVNANDITILIRTNKEVPLISDYFEKHPEVIDVKVVSDEAFRLDASPAINIIICALRVLAEPDSTLHLATLTHHVASTPEAFNEAARHEMRFKPITEQVEEIYQIFRLDQLPHQDAYLFYFNDIVDQFCEENLTDLDTFLQAWDDNLCEKTIPNGTSDGVRIMTMHKSKGLEFHSVIIPSCSWSIKPKDSELMWCMPKSAPYNQMPLLPISVSRAKDDSIFAEDRREEELRTLVDNINVLYVAFTRAKHNLIILTGNKMGETLGEKPPIDTAQAFLVRAIPEKMEQRDIEGVMTQYELGEIVPTQPKKKEKEKNVMECEYDPLPVSFASHPSVAKFRQSYDSDLFITEDSQNPKIQQHAERIRLISLGNLYHSIFQYIHTINDVPHTIQMLKSKGCFGTLLDAEEAQQAVTDMIKGISTEYPEWFSTDWQVLNERAILFLEKKMKMTSKRPDRVVVKGQQAILIDYKTAQGAVKRNADGTFVAPTENKDQIEKYKELLSEIGYTDVKAYLWYILDQIIVPV